VARNGNVIIGVGLDRETGLFHQIEPLLHDCVPAATPTEEEVRAALNWLLYVWLVDVNADATSKLLALMLCLSMIERVLLKERPGWFITAGHRGGGKTTLINMLTTAVFGRMAAAAGWSDNEEERRKALFSYLRQSVAVVCWDNIPRGAKITSACIEKTLTSPEVSDRVLGESTFETAPGGTVQIFTGNNIGPKGDMCSRSFSLLINVDRPDPENRPFEHPDRLDRAAPAANPQVPVHDPHLRLPEPAQGTDRQDPLQGLVAAVRLADRACCVADRPNHRLHHAVEGRRERRRGDERGQHYAVDAVGRVQG
jgi:hypothetical protein